MTFGQVINEYLSTYNISAKLLSQKSGVSASTVSRLRNTAEGITMSDEQLASIANAIEELSKNVVSADDVRV